MKTKQKYTNPQIQKVELDMEFSLQLESEPTPMGEPDWSSSLQVRQETMLEDEVW
jgi:hypothetical protein